MTGRAKIEGASEKRVGRDDGRETPEKSALVFEVLYCAGRMNGLHRKTSQQSGVCLHPLVLQENESHLQSVNRGWLRWSELGEESRCRELQCNSAGSMVAH